MGSQGVGEWSWKMNSVLPQLYELDADPKRKEFLDDLFSFMQKRGEWGDEGKGPPLTRLGLLCRGLSLAAPILWALNNSFNL